MGVPETRDNQKVRQSQTRFRSWQSSRIGSAIRPGRARRFYFSSGNDQRHFVLRQIIMALWAQTRQLNNGVKLVSMGTTMSRTDQPLLWDRVYGRLQGNSLTRAGRSPAEPGMEIMNKERFAKHYMWGIAVTGSAITIFSGYRMRIDRIDLRFMLLALMVVIASPDRRQDPSSKQPHHGFGHFGLSLNVALWRIGRPAFGR